MVKNSTLLSKAYVFDLETTTEQIPSIAYLSGFCKIEGAEESYCYFTDFDDFIEEIMRLPNGTVMYAHNLKFDWSYLFGRLKGSLRHKDIEIKEFITGMAKKVMWVKLFRNGTCIELRDSFTLFYAPLAKVLPAWNKSYVSKGKVEYYTHVPSEISLEMLEYFKTDIVGLAEALNSRIMLGRGKITTSSDAKEIVREMVNERFKQNKNAFSNWFFPNLRLELDEDLRKYYKGGFCYVNPLYKSKLLKKKVTTFDINSMYPAIMEEEMLPYGQPTKFVGEPDRDRMFCVSFTVDSIRIKDGKVPFLVNGSKNSYFSTLYVEEVDKYSDISFRTFHLTNVEFDLLKDFYDYKGLKFIGGYYFKTRDDLFKPFIDKFRNMKEQNTGALREGAKRLLVAPSGKWGQNPKNDTYFSVLQEGVQKFKINKEDTRKKEAFYLPVSIFTTAYARVKLIRQIDKVGINNFIYCDTDSIHCFGGKKIEKLFDIHPTKFGYWKNEGDAENSIYHRPKRYAKLKAGKLEFTCAGIDNKYFAHFTKLSDFKEGVSVSVMRMKQVEGGMQPVMVDITI